MNVQVFEYIHNISRNNPAVHPAARYYIQKQSSFLIAVDHTSLLFLSLLENFLISFIPFCGWLFLKLVLLIACTVFSMIFFVVVLIPLLCEVL